MHTSEGIWLSITDYSLYKKVSISTIRRHLRAKILNYKEEDGKYFIYVAKSEKIKIKEEEEILKAKLEIEFLKNQLRKYKEENIGLRMLVDIYEGNTKAIIAEPPEIPTVL
jgi:hypothetical protein